MTGDLAKSSFRIRPACQLRRETTAEQLHMASLKTCTRWTSDFADGHEVSCVRLDRRTAILVIFMWRRNRCTFWQHVSFGSTHRQTTVCVFNSMQFWKSNLKKIQLKINARVWERRTDLKVLIDQCIVYIYICMIDYYDKVARLEEYWWGISTGALIESWPDTKNPIKSDFSNHKKYIVFRHIFYFIPSFWKHKTI